MIIFGEFAQGLTDAERAVGLLGLIVVISLLAWTVGRWFGRGEVRPDPWDKEVATQLTTDDTIPICHHCLAPHGAADHFCPECGAAVGDCTTLLPFHYVFAMGHGLRVGTTEKFRRTPLTLCGFFLFGGLEYGLFAPVYWYRLLRNLRKPAPNEPPETDAPPGEASDHAQSSP